MRASFRHRGHLFVPVEVSVQFSDPDGRQPRAGWACAEVPGLAIAAVDRTPDQRHDPNPELSEACNITHGRIGLSVVHGALGQPVGKLCEVLLLLGALGFAWDAHDDADAFLAALVAHPMPAGFEGLVDDLQDQDAFERLARRALLRFGGNVLHLPVGVVLAGELARLLRGWSTAVEEVRAAGLASGITRSWRPRPPSCAEGAPQTTSSARPCDQNASRTTPPTSTSVRARSGGVYQLSWPGHRDVASPQANSSTISDQSLKVTVRLGSERASSRPRTRSASAPVATTL